MSQALNNIDLTAAQRKEVAALLQRYLPDTEVWAYGSRVKFTAKPHSDLDMVAFAAKEQSQAVANLREAFEESYLPFRVDLFVWDEVPEEFHGNIEEARVVVQEKKYDTKPPNNWKILTLSKIINLIGGGTPKRSKQEYWNGNIPWLSVKDFNNQYRYVDSAEETITELGEQESSTRVLKTGQLIISARGTVGALAQLTQPMAFNQSCYGIDAKREYTGNDFLYYLVKYSIDNLKQITHGAVFDTITRETFNHIEVSLPPLPEQKAIAHILGSLDDKIELNRRMNETLEAMAQALFKSWFVDFDPVIDNALAAGNAIPDELKKKAAIRQGLGDKQKSLPDDIRRLFPSEFAYTEEMGWIPKGWEINPLDRLIEIISGGTPKTNVSEYWNGGIPWFSVVDAPYESRVFVVETEKYITQAGLENSSAKILPIGTTIVSARGTVGRLALVGSPMAMNQSCYGIRGKNKDAYWTYFMLKDVVNKLKQRTHGSVFDTITRQTFSSVRVTTPPTRCIAMFEECVLPLLEKIKSNVISSVALGKTHDILLPKLVSGEIGLEQLEQILEDRS